MRTLCYRIGLAQSFSLAIYALSLVIAASKLESTLGSPVVETIIYLLFALAIYFVSRGFNRAQNWARTPYLVIQMFGIIVAYTLLSGNDLGYRIAGLVLGLSSVLGIYGLVKTPIEN